MAAVPTRPSPTRRAASAVELAATSSTPGRLAASQARTWAVATGIDMTARMSASVVPFGASRFWWIGITISRWISRSWSNARASIDALTVPSMAFSMATKPRSTSPRSVTASTSGMDATGTSSPCARSSWLRRASSVNVPRGPRKAIRGMAQHNTTVDEEALRRLLDGVRSGEVPADDAVALLRRLPWADLGFARVDHHRSLRQGTPEAVFAPGKTAEQCAAIVAELLDADGGPVLLTRADKDQVDAATA